MRKDIFKWVRKEWNDYLKTGKDKIDKKKSKIEGYNSDDLLKCYEEWSGEEYEEIQDAYQTAAELLKKYEIPSLSEDNIDEFIEGVEEKEYVCKGIFLSAIINELYKDRAIHLAIHLYSNNFNHIGYHNKDKKIVIESNCGDWTGEYMESGMIVIEGNCGIGAGTGMKGGEIVVEGDCEDRTGEDMTSGKIVVKGNCDYETGLNMSGGEIIVKGDCGNSTGEYMSGGEIVVDGNCGDRTGEYMERGKIVVKGDCGAGTGENMEGGKIKIYGDKFNPKRRISKFAEKGEIYHKDELVWKDGELI